MPLPLFRQRCAFALALSLYFKTHSFARERKNGENTVACDVVIVRESVNTLWKKLPRHNVWENLCDLERTRYFGKTGFLFCVVDLHTWATFNNVNECAKKSCLVFYGVYCKKQIHCSYIMAGRRPQARPLTEYRIVVKRYDNTIERKSKIYLYS